MKMSEDYILVKKGVKHARIRVSEDGTIRVIIPYSFTEDDIVALLEKKKHWVAKNQQFFKSMGKISMQRNQLLLYGNRYNYFYEDTYKHKVIIDHTSKTIRAKRDLLSHEIQEAWYKSIAKKHLLKRTEELAAKLNFYYNSVYVRNQKKKWGNCSKDKNISLNWRLIKAPLFVIDYLIVHELVHTQIMNHSIKFWTMLKSHYPDYKAAVNWLEKYGNSL